MLTELGHSDRLKTLAKFTSTLAFKSSQMTDSLTAPMILKGLGSIRGYFGLNIFRKLNTFV